MSNRFGDSIFLFSNEANQTNPTAFQDGSILIFNKSQLNFRPTIEW
jgi:hypothetical protein